MGMVVIVVMVPTCQFRDKNSYGKKRVHGGVEQSCWSKICCGKILNELIWKGEGRKDIIYLKLSNDHVDPTRFGNFKTR
jgi:hypothetical protein